MINRYCENCGKILNKQTLICDACGTDYNEKPECDHVYNEFMIHEEFRDMKIKFLFRCEKCKEVTAIPCRESMVYELIGKLR